MAFAAVHHDELELRNCAVDIIDSLGARLRCDEAGVLCSREPSVLAIGGEMVDLIPADFAGVKRFFLPIAPTMPSNGVGRFAAYTSVLNPGAIVSERALEGTNYALKVVISGSITYGEHTLTASDWLWIPEAASYSFAALELGAVVFTALACVDDNRPSGDSSDPRTVALERIDTVDGRLKSRAGGDFISSRDAGVRDAVASLGGLRSFAEDGDDITHRPLPFAPHMPRLEAGDGRFFAWLSMLEPGVVIPRHSHSLEKLADYKVVVSGSIDCKGQALTSGDWLWAPRGGSYSFAVGDKGALLLSGWPHN